jgi:hypothetical protein
LTGRDALSVFLKQIYKSMKIGFFIDLPEQEMFVEKLLNARDTFMEYTNYNFRWDMAIS